MERFNLRAPEGTGISNDLRWLIYRDVGGLFRDTPWAGLGLGNFDPVFAVFRNASLGQLRSLHPESDWFWLGLEAGWPAVLLLLLGVAFLARRAFPFNEGSAQRLRLACLIAAFLFVLHGFVDVAGHRVGSVFAGLFLFGLALRRPQEGTTSRALPIFFRTVGIVLVAVGGLWVVASLRGLPIPGSLGADLAQRSAIAANAERQHAETIAHATRGLAWAPLNWQLYFLRALGEVGARRPSEAVADFRRARFLEPNSFEVPYQEGLAWLPKQSGLTMIAWNEALRRARSGRQELYGRMLTQAGMRNVKVKEMLSELVATEPDLALVYFSRTRGNDFNKALDRLLLNDPALSKLTAEERALLFTLWADRGDLARLALFLDAHPEFLNIGWPGIAQQKAAAGDYRGAFELVHRFATKPNLPPARSGSGEELQKALLANPGDFLAAVALYQQQMQARNANDALITVRRVLGNPQAPAYFHYLVAEASAAREDWEGAWKAWEQYRGANAR